jgi:NTE family protein
MLQNIMANDIHPPKIQRALVLQGGGSLGAYEAGVFHILYHWIKKDIKGNETENIFDIIAGTSIGAVNASIIINHFIENKEKNKDNKHNNKNTKYWEFAPEKLIQFWMTISSPYIHYDSLMKFLVNNWDNNRQILLNIFPLFEDLIPSGESMRRYQFTRTSITFGEPYIFHPLFIPPFPTPIYNKFFDYIYPTTKWYQYSNQPLARSIISFADKLVYDKTSRKGGIKTYYEKGEPRLLLIAADVETATTGVFDSYNYNNNNNDVDDHIITINHVLASAAIPKNFPFVEINGKKYWDGGILSNTPVRELVHKYDNFWVKILGLDSDNSSANSESNNKLIDNDIVELNKIINQKKIPNLELSIVNLHPSEERNEQIPSLYDYDMTKDRENDIRFHDKTENDIRMTQFVSDYHELAINLFNLVIDSLKKMKEAGNKNDDINNLKKELKDILNQVQRTSSHEGKPRYYYDLLTKKFDVEEVIKVQRKDDKHTISDKIFDFSSITISNLIREGEKDTLNELMQHEIENKGNKTALNEFEKFIRDIKDEKIESEENQYIIQLAEEKLNELRKSISK